MAAMTRAKPGWDQEPGTALGSPMWVAEAQTLGPSSTASPGMLTGSQIGIGAAGT